MVVVREEKSGNGRITLCQSQDGCRQLRYNLTPSALSNHSEFEGDGARNTCAYHEHTHGQLYILDAKPLILKWHCIVWVYTIENDAFWLWMFLQLPE